MYKIENRRKACDLAIEYDRIESFMEFVSSLRAEDYIEFVEVLMAKFKVI